VLESDQALARFGLSICDFQVGVVLLMIIGAGRSSGWGKLPKSPAQYSMPISVEASLNFEPPTARHRPAAAHTSPGCNTTGYCTPQFAPGFI